MSSTLLRKISVVSKGGLSIAEYPPTRGESEKQLESGLLSAILSFSREVHQSELEALSFHDRTVSFLQFETFFVVPEFASNIDKNILQQILQQMKSEVNDALEPLGDNFEPNHKFAKLLLQRITESDWLDEALSRLGLDKPLKNAEVHKFSSDLRESEISKIVTEPLINYKPENEIITYLLPLEHKNKVFFVVAKNHQDHYKGHYLSVPFDMVKESFKLVPTLNKEIEFLTDIGVDNTEEIVKKLKDTHDIGFQLNEDVEEFISISFLKKNLKKRIDRLLYATITGKRIVVIGDKISVKIVLYTLQLFSQHLNTEVVEWIEEEDKIGRDFTGMSPDRYENSFKQIIDAMDEKPVIVDLRRNKIIGNNSNKYLSKYFEQTTKMSKDKRANLIKSDLDELVTLSLKITPLIYLPEEKAKKEMIKIKKQIDDNSKFEIVKELATQRSPLVEEIVKNISETLQSAENFLGQF